MYVKGSDDTILNTDKITAVKINPMNSNCLFVYFGTEKPILIDFDTEQECSDYLSALYDILSGGAK